MMKQFLNDKKDFFTTLTSLGNALNKFSTELQKEIEKEMPNLTDEEKKIIQEKLNN